MATITYTVAGVTTATTPRELRVGQIVMLPDGRAGEITGYAPSAENWLAVRAWDENTAYAYPATELQPWIEE